MTVDNSKSLLTNEQCFRYLKDPGQCPFCQSPDINGDSFERGYREVWQNVTCNECNGCWRGIYRLAYVEDAN